MGQSKSGEKTDAVLTFEIQVRFAVELEPSLVRLHDTIVDADDVGAVTDEIGSVLAEEQVEVSVDDGLRGVLD